MTHTKLDKLKKLIEKNTVVDQDTNCHLWQSTLRDGYARTQIMVDGILKNKTVHRLVYEINNGAIPEHTVVHHTCGVRNCINIEHLQAVSSAENTAEMLERQSYLKKIASLEEELSILKSSCVCKPKTDTIQ